ncbi:modifier of protein aggregation 4-like [Bolinopsis microptera]|uniref:modifier of protein aggregation 4-like n=1 Tax=Bolinopsis microptera TaxID=2820187 RepID=UPI0030793CFC
MARGNQRDLAREKAAKKNKGKNKETKDQDGNKGLTHTQRQERDAEVMRKKQEAAAAKKAEQGQSSK